MKSIHRACRGSARVRVCDYDSDTVHQGIAQSRMAIIGIDRNEPVISGERLAPYLNPTEEVLVIDFNTFGSCEGLDNLSGVRLIDAAKIEEKVRDYAERLSRNPEFQTALDTVEPMVRNFVRDLVASPREEREAEVSGQTYAMGVA